MDPDEIVITLKNLTTAGFTKIESSLTSVEAKANATSMSGFSKSTKTVEKDAEAAAGKAGGGGMLGMVSALTGIPGPAALAVGAVALVGGALFEAGQTSEKVTAQQDLLNAAFQAHGDSLSKEQPIVDAMIKKNENFGASADDTRGAITELAQAGQNMSEIQAAMPAITDLAIAKHESLTDASKSVELAEMGNARALKELGIILPKTGISTMDLATAQDKVKTASGNLKTAQDNLAAAQEKVSGKTKPTAKDMLDLQKAHDAVTVASGKLKDAQDQLGIVQDGGADKTVRQSAVLDALTKKLGNQGDAVTPMQKVTAKLNDTWENFSMKVGPGVQGAITGLLNNAVIPLMDDANSLIDYLAGVWGWLEQTGIISDFGTAFNLFVVTPFKIGWTAVNDLVGLLQQLWQKLQDVGKAIASSPIGQLGGMVSGAAGAVGGLIPKFFAGGGVVGGSGPVPIIAHGGEGVFTPDQMAALGGSGGGGNHFHVHFDSLVTPTPQQMRDVAHALEPEFGRMLALRGTAALNGGF